MYITMQEDGEEFMKKRNRQVLWAAVSICTLVAVILTLIFQYVRQTNARIIEQNQHYLEDASAQTLKSIDGLFRDSVSNISMISSFYQQFMDNKDIDYSKLNILRAHTTFDYVRYVDMDGISYAADGETRDVSDRDYFKDGIQGNAGVTFVLHSKFTNARMLVFYAPLYHNSEIVGLLVGGFDEAHLQELMSASYFGESARAYLCLKDGSVVACIDDNYPENILDDLKKGHVLTDDKMAELRQAFEEGKSYSFTYKDKNGIGNGCITVLKNIDWVMVNTFPATAGKRIQENAYRDALRLEIKLIMVFAIYIIVVALYYISKNGRLRRKSESYSQIINSVRQLYDRFIVFDFENNTYDYLEKGTISPGVQKAGDYFEWLNTFPQKHFLEEDAERFLDEFSPENLKNNLNLDNRFVQYEYELAGKKRRWEKYSLIKLNMDGNETRRVLAAVEDVTALIQEELEKRHTLEQVFRDAESANNAKMDFLSRMSHDIRTPLNAIIGLTAVAEAHMEDRKRIGECLAKISAAGNHLLTLLNDVLDMSKIESGEFSLAESDFNLKELVWDVVEMVRPSAIKKHQNFKVNMEKFRHENVTGDSLRVYQIFVNILGNAVKFTDEGGDITLTLSELENHNKRLASYEFVFADTGIGMSEEFLKQLFQPFKRAEDERVSKNGGPGLGLSIVRNIVRAMDGTIRVESEPGKGSVFTVSITLKLQDVVIDEEQEEQSQFTMISEMDFSGKRALLVEDNEINLEIATEILGTTGLQMESAENGQIGLEKFSQSKEGWYSIIFMDIQMPVMNGYEAAAAIRKLPREDAKNIPIVAMTANTFSEDMQEAKAAGMNGHIAKPLSPEGLGKILKQWL